MQLRGFRSEDKEEEEDRPFFCLKWYPEEVLDQIEKVLRHSQGFYFGIQNSNRLEDEIQLIVSVKEREEGGRKDMWNSRARVFA